MLIPLHRLFRIFALSLCFALLGANAALSEEVPPQTLVMATPEGEYAFTEYLKKLYAKLSKNTGLQFEVLEYPKQRALLEANSGRAHGLAARIAGLQQKHLPNLRMINASVFTVEHVLFASKPRVLQMLKDSDDAFKVIRSEGLSVGYLRGSKKAEALLAKIPDELKKNFVHPEEAFSLIEKKRLDVFLGGPGMVSRAILKTKYPHSPIQEATVVSETKLFPYLHMSHAEFIPKIETALRHLQEDGTLKELRRSIEQ